jgi:hypothetical protein
LVAVLLAVGVAIALFHPGVSQAASAESPSLEAQVIASGSARTDIGRVKWTAVKGDATNLPFGQVFATPRGYAAFEPFPTEHGWRFWRSSDGLAWSVAPMPVPTNGGSLHRMAGGEHWILAPQDFRLWRSIDFETWTEVDLTAVKPPVVSGIDWDYWPAGLAAVGPKTVLPWNDVHGALTLDDLLGVELEPGERLRVGTIWDEPILGEQRDVWLKRRTAEADQEDDGTRVGSIKVVSDGSMVSVIDVTRDAVVATIDAETVGVPADIIAEGLNREGRFAIPANGIVVEHDVARPLEGPHGISYLEPVGGGLVALAGEVGDAPTVWASRDGVDWEALGPPVLASASPTWSGLVDWFQPLRRPARASQETLEAVVDVTRRGRQGQELWTSIDGREWVRTSVLATHPEPSMQGIGAFTRGYLGIGDDYKVRVSVDGRKWTHLKRLRGIGRSIMRSGPGGGISTTSVAPDSMFRTEDPNGPERLVWKITVDPEG